MLLLLILTLGLFLVSPAFVLAQSIPTVTHLPSIADKLFEKVSLLFRFSPSAKYSYYTQLLDKRLGEIAYVVSRNDLDNVEQTTSRYQTYVAVFTDFTTANLLASSHSTQLVQLFDAHTKKLAELQTHYPSNTSFSMLIQHDLNSIKIALDKLQVRP